MKVEYFSKSLFTFLARKLIDEENLDSPERNLDTSEKNVSSAEENLQHSDSNDDVSRSVLMLSYVYRPAFKERFTEVLSILMHAEENPMTFVRCFAEASREKYSPLKFLVLCAFISEIFHYKYLVITRQHCYVQQTTDALNEVFHSSFEKDFPPNGWSDIQDIASQIAKGYKFLVTFMKHDTLNVSVYQVTELVLNEWANEHQPTDVVMDGTTSQEMAGVNISSEPSSQAEVDAIEIPIISPEGLPTNGTAYLAQNDKCENEQQPTYVMAGTTSQEMVSVNTPSELNSQVLVNVIEVPILSPEGLLTNQTAYLAQNLVYTPVYPVSFGTVEENAQLSYLLYHSGHQTEAATFQIGTVSNFQSAEPSNTESTAQENSVAKNPEDEAVPIFRTVKLTESGLIEPSTANNVISFEQELMDAEAQFMKELLSEDASESSFQTPKKTENSESENCIASNAIVSDQEPVGIDGKFGENNFCLSSKIETLGDPIEGCSNVSDKHDIGCGTESLSKENDSERETFQKENVNDPEGEIFLNDSDSEIFSKEEKSLASVNVPENQSGTFSQKQANAAFKDFTTDEVVTSRENDAWEANEIEINVKTDENNLAEKLVHLDLGGRKFVVRMPADMRFIFKYEGRTLKR